MTDTQRLLRTLALVSGAAIATLALTSCSSNKTTAEAAPAVEKAAVVQVQRAVVPTLLEVTGTVRAKESAQLAAQVMGNVTMVAVREGDAVKRGQVLITISDEQLRAGVDRAQAALNAANHEAAAAESGRDLAAATMKRYGSLFEKKAVSPQEFDEVRAKMREAEAQTEMAHAGQAQAKAALAQANEMAAYTRIRAPFDGIVTERRVDPGALAAPGMPLLTVEGRGAYRLEANIDESALSAVKMGQQVPVAIDSLAAEQMKGKVVQIVPAADPASRSFVVKVELPSNPNLRSGLFGRARFSLGDHDAIALPRTAVINRGQLQGLFIVGDDRIATLRYVTLGQPTSDKVEILSGVNPGEYVVADPGARELAGKRIEVQ